jgi:hypothetical protein
MGQDEAVTAVADAVIRARFPSTINTQPSTFPARPIGSFIFLGPSGVGKTVSARSRRVDGQARRSPLTLGGGLHPLEGRLKLLNQLLELLHALERLGKVGLLAERFIEPLRPGLLGFLFSQGLHVLYALGFGTANELRVDSMSFDDSVSTA